MMMTCNTGGDTMCCLHFQTWILEEEEEEEVEEEEEEEEEGEEGEGTQREKRGEDLLEGEVVELEQGSRGRGGARYSMPAMSTSQAVVRCRLS